LNPGETHVVHNALLQQRIEAIALAFVISLLIFELVRRRHLMERYALLWLIAAATVLVLAIWNGLLTTLAHAVGIHYIPSALFAVTFIFVLVMLVHFSMTISRLSDQNTVLAQRLALLQERVDLESGARANGTAAPDAPEKAGAGAPSPPRAPE
jgi:hypothetical protein